ncbi:hypothetical protein EIP91_007996, partial [Steccherinum ochraceum]
MASKAATHYLQYDIQWSSLALLYYDYALTFPMEVQYLWRDKFRLSTILYVFCRYALVANVLYLLAISDKLTDEVRDRLLSTSMLILKSHSCNSWYKFLGALSVLGRAAVIITFTGRVYAVWSQNQYILAYLSILGLACIALDITHVPGLRCVGSSSIPIGTPLQRYANHLLSILMATFEFSAVVLTAVRCVQSFRAGSATWGSERGGLLYVIFEQGVLIMSAFTIATVVLIYRGSSGFWQRLLNALTLPLSGLLTARFLLHVRRWDFERTGGIRATAGSNFDSQDNSVVFRVAGLISTIVDEFVSDPVARAATKSTTEADTTLYQGSESASSNGIRTEKVIDANAPEMVQGT